MHKLNRCSTNDVHLEDENFGDGEVLQVVRHMKTSTTTIFKNVVLTTNEYLITAFADQQNNDINIFCSTQKTPLVMYNTFNLCSLWLRHTANQNLRLVNNKDPQYPWFYGPFLLHMKKRPQKRLLGFQ